LTISPLLAILEIYSGDEARLKMSSMTNGFYRVLAEVFLFNLLFMAKDSDEKRTEREILLLIANLGLKDIDETIPRLVTYGSKAIEPLSRYLLNGRPTGTFQGRQWAVMALARLGARDVLKKYLSLSKDITDPVVDFGEEAVESTAARELARWPDEDTFQFLMDYAKRKKRIGTLEALGEFKRKESVKLLIDALGDDFYRQAAKSSLRKIGRIAYRYLLNSLVSKSKNESPSDIRRKEIVISLLNDLGISKKDWLLIRSLLKHPSPGIVAGATKIAAKIAPKKDRVLAARKAIDAYTSANWWIRIELEDCLNSLLPESGKILDEAIGHGDYREDIKDRLVKIREKLNQNFTK